MRARVWVAIATVFLLFVAACGSDDDTTAADEPAEEPAAEPAEEPSEEPAEEPSEEPAEEPSEEPAEEPAEASNLPDEIVIGSPLDMSGVAAVAAVGVSELDGIELAVQEIHETGFLGDTQIKIEAIDTLGDKQEAIRATLDLISKDVDAVVGYTLTPSWLAATPQLQEAGIPAMAIELSAAGVTEVGDLMFRLYPNMGVLIPKGDVEFAEFFGGGTAAYLHQSDAGATAEIHDARKAALEAAGVETVADQTMSGSDTDVRAQLTAIADADPDFFVMTVLPGLMSTVFLQAAEIGLDAQLLGQIPNPQLLEQAGPEMECSVYIAPWAPFFEGGNNQHFLDYWAENGEDREPDLFVAAGYSAMWAMAHGIKQANSVEGADIAAALASMDDIDTAYGTVNFRTNRSASIPGAKAIIMDSQIVPWDETIECGS